MDAIKPYHQRMAELWTIGKRRKLTFSEQREMEMCQEANAADVWKRIKLENLSLIAAMTNDTEWQHELCAEMEDSQSP
jgi:hypothetical protein